MQGRGLEDTGVDERAGGPGKGANRGDDRGKRQGLGPWNQAVGRSLASISHSVTNNWL